MSELLERALDAIRAKRQEARARGVELIGVVGSVARGDDGPDSDIDIAYDIIGPASLLDVAHLLNALEDALDRPIDMVDISQVRERGRKLLKRDLVAA